MSNEVRDILNERGDNYGSYSMVSAVSQGIKGVIRNGSNYDELPSYVKESIDMIANKLSRIVNGKYEYKDSYVDIIGYTQLILDELEKDKKHEEMMEYRR